MLHNKCYLLYLLLGLLHSEDTAILSGFKKYKVSKFSFCDNLNYISNPIARAKHTGTLMGLEYTSSSFDVLKKNPSTDKVKLPVHLTSVPGVRRRHDLPFTLRIKMTWSALPCMLTLSSFGGRSMVSCLSHKHQACFLVCVWPLQSQRNYVFKLSEI